MLREPQTSTRGPEQVLGAISWVLLIAVMFGGESLLRMLSSGEGMAAHEEQFFRAGHGHAGVLTIIGILYSSYLGKTLLSNRVKVIAWSVYALGVGMLAGGMFLHAYIGEPDSSSAGTYLTATGGVVLAGAVLFLAWNLVRNPKSGETS
jgi:hypothetical protein